MQIVYNIRYFQINRKMDVKKLFDLHDKIVIITGAAGNLGSQYAEGLSQMGANVVLCDIDFKKLEKISDNLNKRYDVESISLKLDLTKKSSISNLVKKTVQKLDILLAASSLSYKSEGIIEGMRRFSPSFRRSNSALYPSFLGSPVV